MDRIAFHGRGLHTGALCNVAMDRDLGPVRLRIGKKSLPLDELEVLRTDYGVQVGVQADPNFRLDLFEHLCADLAGLVVYEDVEIRASGPEVPLLDGGALEFSLALLGLDLPEAPPRYVIARPGELSIGTARYTFQPANHVLVQVCVDFPGVGEQWATWDGTRSHFLAEIAPARTFGFRKDHERLLAAGRARVVDPRSVMVLDDAGAVMPPGGPMRGAELARHKLLDLLGDLYLCGGPLLGELTADHPGHGNNHRLMRAAKEAQLIRRV
ncbi:MAG: UDP-3-O-acyl-N-acetylglucosamine deacetylase [Myxococcales bacterium]|nr:UDP-3-O-acyl-N-acetylglucosamine deacetylase [Myxococcales bacterium]